MKQNKYFNPGRFARLLRNDLMINQKIYLFAIIGLGIAIYAFTYLIMRTNGGGFNRHDDYIPLILIYLMVIGAIIGTAFPALNNQIKTSNYLLAPGSTFEKYMIQFVIRVVLFIPLALVIFWIGVHLAKASLIPNPRLNINPSKIPDFNFPDLFKGVPTFRDKLVIVISIFSVSTVLFAGSVYFNRFALVKTLITSAIGIGLVFLLFVLLSHLFFPRVTHGFENRLLSHLLIVQENGSPIMVENPYNMKLLWYAIGHFSWLFFLPLAYFKLKEKEV